MIAHLLISQHVLAWFLIPIALPIACIWFVIGIGTTVAYCFPEDRR